eukprot:14077419-Alexandrium_andersonii.AAC.1
MSASLVGSEMCIRDRPQTAPDAPGCPRLPRTAPDCPGLPRTAPDCPRPVSYTHLTLPTICSV